MRAGGVTGADLAAALGAEQRQLGAAGGADGVVLADGRAALWAERLSAGIAFRRAGCDGRAAVWTNGAGLEPAADAGAFFGQEEQIALWAEARATLWAGAFRRRELGATFGAGYPTHDQGPHTMGHAAGRRALLVRHRLSAARAAVGGVEEGLAAGGAATGKDDAAVRTDLSAGEELHPTSGTGESERQLAVGTAFDVFAHGGAAAGAEGLPTRGAGWVAAIDAGAAVGTGQVAGPLRLRWASVLYLSEHGPALEDESAVGTDLVF